MSRPWPRRLKWGLALLGLEATVALLGPLFFPDPALILDPPGASLQPPLSQVVVVQLDDGTLVAGRALVATPEGLQLQRGQMGRALSREQVRRTGRRFFLLGSDSLGRDVASRLLAAGRVSLGVGLLALLLALILGTGVGLLAGLGPRWLDRILMALVDAFLAVPLLFLLLALAAFLRPSLGAVVLFLGASTWMGVARLVRGQTLQAREQPWFLAARALGVGPLRLALVHLLPHLATPLVQDATLRLGDLILLEAALSFLGFGVPPPAPSWGNMAAEGFEVWRLAWWLPILPGLAVAATVLAFALVADGLGELSRGQRER